MKKLVFLIICFISFSLTTFSQSAYLSKGQTGFGIGGGYLKTNDKFDFTSIIGLSISGVFDLGLRIDSYNPENSIYDVNVVSPYTSVFLLKQSETMPASLALNASYSKEFYSTEELKPSDIDLKKSYFSIGLSLYSFINLTNSFSVQPFMGSTYSMGKTIIETPPSEEKFDGGYFTMGLSMVFRNTENSTVVIEPKYKFSNYIRTFGLSLSYIFY